MKFSKVKREGPTMTKRRVQKALLQSEGHPRTVLLGNGRRLRLSARERWRMGEEFLFLQGKEDVKLVDFHDIASIRSRNRRPDRPRPA
jgi:hypothetical protein